MDRQAIDLATKLAKAISLLEKNPTASATDKVFLVLDKVKPYELDYESIQKILNLDRGAVGPAVKYWVDWGYLQDRGGMVSRGVE
jgi:hypothetical protein